MLCSVHLTVISKGHQLMNSPLDQVSLKWLVWPFYPLLSESLWRNVCNFVTVTKCDGMWFSVKEQFFSKGKKEFLFFSFIWILSLRSRLRSPTVSDWLSWLCWWYAWGRWLFLFQDWLNPHSLDMVTTVCLLHVLQQSLTVSAFRCFLLPVVGSSPCRGDCLVFHNIMNQTQTSKP